VAVLFILRALVERLLLLRGLPAGLSLPYFDCLVTAEKALSHDNQKGENGW